MWQPIDVTCKALARLTTGHSTFFLTFVWINNWFSRRVLFELCWGVWWTYFWSTVIGITRVLVGHFDSEKKIGWNQWLQRRCALPCYKSREHVVGRRRLSRLLTAITCEFRPNFSIPLKYGIGTLLKGTSTTSSREKHKKISSRLPGKRLEHRRGVGTVTSHLARPVSVSRLLMIIVGENIKLQLINRDNRPVECVERATTGLVNEVKGRTS